MDMAGFLRDIGGEEVRYAWGYGGQMLYIVPALELSVVMTSDEYSPSAGNGHRDALHALLAEIITAVRAGELLRTSRWRHRRAKVRQSRRTGRSTWPSSMSQPTDPFRRPAVCGYSAGHNPTDAAPCRWSSWATWQCVSGCGSLFRRLLFSPCRAKARSGAWPNQRYIASA